MAGRGFRGPPAVRLRLFPGHVRLGHGAGQEGQGLRLRPERRGHARLPRHSRRARQGQPFPQPVHRGERGPVRADEERGIPRRLPHAEGQDRHGPPQFKPARPRHVPHPARGASPPGPQVVRVPDVRLGARPRGFHRENNALHLHGGVREPPAAVRLVPGSAGRLPSPADRVRPAEPQQYRAQQAQAAGAGQGRARGRLGRPPHAHHLRLKAPRLYLLVHPRLLRRDRRGQVQQHH